MSHSPEQYHSSRNSPLEAGLNASNYHRNYQQSGVAFLRGDNDNDGNDPYYSSSPGSPRNKNKNRSRPEMIDEAEDPMANVLEEQQTGQMAPRNMSSWMMRATESVLGKRYVTQDAASSSREMASAMMRNAYIQTEPPAMKDASAMIIDGNMESERLNELDIGIPGPADLPVLTTSQLLEMERRLGDLMSRLEDEILRAEGEIKRQKESAAELEKREAIMHSNRFGKWQTNDEWVLHMRNKIEQRLHKRHGYADVPSLPSQKENLDATLNSPLRQKYSRRAKSDLASLLGVGSHNTDDSGSRSHSQDQQSQQSGVYTATPTSVTPRSVTPQSTLQKKGSFVAFQDPVEGY